MNNLRRVRLAADKSQLWLMKKTGIYFATISRIERGWVEPSAKQARQLAKALDVSVDEVFPRSGEALSIHKERRLLRRLSKIMSLEDRARVLKGPGSYQSRLLEMAEKYQIKR